MVSQARLHAARRYRKPIHARKKKKATRQPLPFSLADVCTYGELPRNLLTVQRWTLFRSFLSEFKIVVLYHCGGWWFEVRGVRALKS